MDDSSEKTARLLDRTAMAMSGLCLVHCLLLPVIVLLLPLPGMFANEHFHGQVLAIVLPVSMVAIAFGFRRHGDRRVLVGGAIGMLLLILGGTFVHLHYGVLADSLVTIVGGVILAVTHYFNSRLAKHTATRTA